MKMIVTTLRISGFPSSRVKAYWLSIELLSHRRLTKNDSISGIIKKYKFEGPEADQRWKDGVLRDMKDCHVSEYILNDIVKWSRQIFLSVYSTYLMWDELLGNKKERKLVFWKRIYTFLDQRRQRLKD